MSAAWLRAVLPCHLLALVKLKVVHHSQVVHVDSGAGRGGSAGKQT